MKEERIKNKKSNNFLKKRIFIWKRKRKKQLENVRFKTKEEEEIREYNDNKIGI